MSFDKCNVNPDQDLEYFQHPSEFPEALAFHLLFLSVNLPVCVCAHVGTCRMRLLAADIPVLSKQHCEIINKKAPSGQPMGVALHP